MIITLSRNELLNELNIVGKAVKPSTLPILEHVCINATGTEIIFEGSNMDLTICTKIACIAVEPGSVCINAKQLTDILKKMPDTDITIATDARYAVTLSAGKKIKFQIEGKNPEPFPVFKEEDGDVISLDGSELKEAVSGVAFCTAKAETNKMMTGIQLKITGDKVRLCGLDGHRIGMRTIQLKAAVNQLYDIIIPTEYLEEIIKIIPNEDVEMTVNDKKVMFKVSNITIMTRLIEGQYYQIEQMLSNNFATTFEVKRSDLYATVDRAMIVLTDAFKRPVVFNVGSDAAMHINGISTIGKVEEEVEMVSKTGSDLRIGFNPRFIADMLRVITDDVITINAINAKSPITVANNEQTYKYIVLPVNITE